MDEQKRKDLQRKMKEGLKRALQRLRNIKTKEETIGDVLRKSVIEGLEKFLQEDE